MPTKLLNITTDRRSFKLGRLKRTSNGLYQRAFLDCSPRSLDPDSILINKIIKNIKQEARGKNHG